MNPESSESPGKPTLSAESFQRLLAAAYLLQGENDRAQVQSMITERSKTFAAGAIVQKRTPRLAVPPQSVSAEAIVSRARAVLQAPRNAAGPVASDIIFPDSETRVRRDIAGRSPRYSAKRKPVLSGRAPQAIKTLVSRATLWRGVDALAISAVFLAIVGVSIHGLWASRGSMPSGVLSAQEARSTAGGLPSSQHPAEQVSRPSIEQTEANVIAEDTVIRYPVRAVSAAKKPRNTGILAADAVVHYGSDVKMWSGNPKRTGLEGLGR